jgi:hypothetical protein
MVEADLEIGFSLIDTVDTFPGERARLVADAEQVYTGILARLNCFEPVQRENFGPLVHELRRAIDLATRPS